LHRDKEKEYETHDEEMEDWETNRVLLKRSFFLSSPDETHDEEMEVWETNRVLLKRSFFLSSPETSGCIDLSEHWGTGPFRCTDNAVLYTVH
jgi:hypothetical protein